MNGIHKILLMLIAMVSIMLIAVGLNKVYQGLNQKKWQEERHNRYASVQAEAEDIKVRIAELSQDEEALRAFLEENIKIFEDIEDIEDIEDTEEKRENQEQMPEDISSSSLSDDALSEADVSGNGVSENNGITASDVSANVINSNGSEESLSGNSLSGNNLSGNSLSGNNLSGNSLSDNYMTYTGISANDLSGNDLSGNDLAAEEQVEETLARIRSGKLTLRERRKLQGSYMETVQANQADKKVIAGSSVDFSNTKIACLGDSITAATNLDSQDNYQQYSYPTKLGILLGAAEVTNLGIGGSSIGRYWDQAFVDRYREIPADTDLIIVMGGTNDGFCVTADDIGNLTERKPDTFAGDLDELMRGLKENYPEAMIIFATPLPNVLHDILRKDRDYLLPQENLVNIINELGVEYQIPVIDLYNSNILDSHDAANIYNFSPDGVHCNPAGYQILAEHFGAEIIKIYEERDHAGSVSTEQ